MSASGSTMKTFQKRLYHALPRAVPTASSSSSPSPISRVRSNSASSPRSLYTASGPSSPLSFFESGGAPAASRPHVARLESRVEIELHSNAHTHGTNQQSPHNSATQGGNPGGGPPPWSLALTTPNSNPSSSPHSGTAHHSVSFFPYAPFTAIPTYNPLISPNPELRPHPKRQRTRYHLDVGAYGIAKRRSRTRNDGSRPSSLSAGTSSEDLHLASAVGEDAYFVRENAMGVADGVGGWSRVRDSESSRNTSSESTASALFARRLMHYCSAELDSPRTRTADLPGPFCEPAPPPPTRTFTRAKSPLSQPTAFARPLPQGRQSTYYAPISQVDELYEEFEDSLEELEEGLDVLMILEKAYERTLKAHVEPVQPSTPSAADTGSVRSLPPTSPLSGWTPQSLDPALDVDALAARISPALTLSSSAERSATGEQYKPLLSGSSTALVAILDYSPTVSDGRNPAPASVADSKETASSPCVESGAVLRIANLGDSMGMLVRGEEIVWRSEEMWTGFNTPLQLGPRSATRPADALVITVPVQADDILILATDGLSDNLWDEEVLDEVVRFRRTFLRKPSADGSDQPAPTGAARPSCEGLLGRRSLAGMLSEALCSRARRVSERGHGGARASAVPAGTESAADPEDEVPFARRAREHGRVFRGGKTDDISVVVAVISPTD